MGKKGDYTTVVDGIVEHHPIKIAVEKPPYMTAPPTNKDIAMSRLGIDKTALFCESVRYAIARGDNFNFVEADLPIGSIEESAVTSAGFSAYEEVPEDQRKRLDALIDKAVSVAADRVIEDVSRLMTMPGIREVREKLSAAFGDNALDIEFDYVDDIPGSDNILVTLKGERTIPTRVTLKDTE